MGAAQSVPVVGEVLTAIDSGVKITGAGVYGVLGEVFDKDDVRDTAKQLVRDAGKSWVEYSERNVIAATGRACIHAFKGNKTEAERVFCKMGKSLGEFVDGVPLVGHIKGGVHYYVGDTEHGRACMKGASRSLLILGAGALTGGVGGGVVLGGLAGVGSGVGYDAVVTGIQGQPYGVIGSVDSVVENLRNRDFYGYVNSSINTAYAVTGDFLAGAAGAEAAERLNKASQQRQALKREMGENATNDTIDAAKHLEEAQKKVTGDRHVCTKAKNVDTGKVSYGYSKRCRQQINGDQQAGTPGLLKETAKDKGIPIEQKIHVGKKGCRALDACAEHDAINRLGTTGADSNLQTTSVMCQKGTIVTVKRCNNCVQFGDLMGRVPTDSAAGLPVPTRQFILDSSTRAVGGAAAYAACAVICDICGTSHDSSDD